MLCVSVGGGASLEPLTRPASNKCQVQRLLLPGQFISLMSLDFFFAPLATKVGASLDQVKAS